MNIFTKPMYELNYLEALAAAVISSGIILGGIAAVAKIHDLTSSTKVETCIKETTMEDVKEDED